MAEKRSRIRERREQLEAMLVSGQARLERARSRSLVVSRVRDSPGAPAAISEKVEQRRDHLDAIRSAEKEEEQSVLARIRAYFGL